MRNNIVHKFPVIVILFFVNPITIYWYILFYKGNLEFLFSFSLSIFMATMLALLVRDEVGQWKLWKRTIWGFFSSLSFSLILLIASQLVFADIVVGFGESNYKGSDAVMVYLGLSFMLPVFWVNMASYVLYPIFSNKENKGSGLES